MSNAFLPEFVNILIYVAANPIWTCFGRNKNRDYYLLVSQIIHSGDRLHNTKEQEVISKFDFLRQANVLAS